MGRLKITSWQKNKQGFTLVEVMLALFILLLVLSIFYSFYFYINRSFDITTKQSDVQQNVRLAESFIEDKVRFAKCIKILDDNAKLRQGLSGYASYEEIYIENGAIMYYKHGGEPYNILSGISNNVDLKLKFDKNVDNANVLKILISGKTNGQYLYLTETEITILNADSIEKNFNGYGVAICFYNESN